MRDAAEPGDAGGCSYVVGQDCAGHWLAVETHGLGGGLFSSREAAFGYALRETGRRPTAVLFSAEPIALALSPLAA